MTLLILTAMLAADPAPRGVTVGENVVVAPDAKSVYARAKTGGIEAIDLTRGIVSWTNKDAGRLAGASDKLVFAWTAEAKKPNAFRVVVMDADTGKTLTKSEVITMPDWATTAKVGGRSFRVGARAEGKDVVLVWQANAFYYGGAAPPPEVEAAARKEATGVVTIDPTSGGVTKLDRKPKDDEFGKFGNKAGDYEFGVTEMLPGFKPGGDRMTTVTLTVVKGKKAVLRRELAGNPWNPPPP